jgi:hypothetical protein
MKMSPLLVKGYKILAYAKRSGLMSRKESLSCHTSIDTGPRVFPVSSKEPPLSVNIFKKGFSVFLLFCYFLPLEKSFSLSEET